MTEIKKKTGSARKGPSGAAAKPAPAKSTGKAPATGGLKAAVKKPAATAKPAVSQPPAAGGKPTSVKRPAGAQKPTGVQKQGAGIKPAGMRKSATGKKTPAAKKPLTRREIQRKKATEARIAAAKKAIPERLGLRPAGRHALKRPPLARQLQSNPLPLVFLVMILAVLTLYGWQWKSYRDYRDMRAAVEASVFYDGTYIDGLDVSGLTLADAQSRFAEEIEPTYAARMVTLSDGTTVTAAMLGYESNFMDVLDVAFHSARNGSLEERYSQVSTIGAEGIHYAVTRSMYDPALVAEFAQYVAQSVDTPVQNAGLSGFDATTYQFTYSEGTPGTTLSQEQLIRDIQATLDAGGGDVTLQIEQIAPTTLSEDVASQYGMISYAVTDASSSKSSRLANIALALHTINGYCLKPGETFSFNEVVGERTPERGYKKAPAFSGGTTVQEYGGGICQVSSTLFNAVVKANLEIVEREAHSMEVDYVSRGRDATVDWGNIDFKFKNTSSEPVYICCVLDSGKNVRIGIFGRLLEDGVSIALDTTTVSRTNYETQYVLNASLAPGARQLKQSGKYAYVTDTYKVLLDRDGNELARSYMFRSRYLGRPQIYELGP